MREGESSPSDGIAIRPLVEDDASALAECFTRCYGDSYVVAEFYDPVATAARIRTGTLRSVVAVTSAGEIVGHMGLTIRDPRAETADAGNSIVDPRYRGRQLVARLALAVIELCREAGFLGFHHYPTTVHAIMQKLAVAGDGIETGILLGYIPSGTEYREIEGEPRRDRPAAVVVYHPVRPAPAREVFVPRLLVDPIRDVYTRAAAALPRTFGAPAPALERLETRLSSTLNERRGLLRIAVERAGRDVAAKVEAEMGRFGEAAVCHVDLPMGDPSAPLAARALAEAGFFFSAVLPEYLQGDVLRLQRLAAADLTPPELVTADARALLAAIEADRARSGSRSR